MKPRTRPTRSLAAMALAAIAATACGLPWDAEGTLDRVEGGTLRVGVIAHPPWTSEDEPAEGVEVQLVERFAGELGARVHYVWGTEENLFEALELRALDLVIGGIAAKNPWSGKVGFTRPYLVTELVIGVPPGMEPPASLEGQEVVVHFGSDAAGLVEKEDARPVPVEDLTEADGRRLVAAEEWELPHLDLEDSGISLHATEHVMAVSPGENAFLGRLQRFLNDHQDLARRLLDEAPLPLPSL